ncbi:MAG: GGDEF domain-containing protein [Gammaproteobacteria bacterium]|nr:GGDEF domain-containing protein [Gammaproteobacteria bacterium]
MSERNDEQRQALRLRRALIGMIGCLAFVVLAWTAREFGLVALPTTGFWLLFGSWAAGYAALVALIHTGRNQGLKDPSCTVPQILWAALGALMLLLLAPELFALSWLALLVVGLFGAFRLSSRRYVTINLMIAGAATAAFVFNRVVWPGVGDTAAAALGYTAFLLALAVVTVVGLELSGYRRELVQRSEQFAQACDRLREMAIRDELTGLHNRRFLMDVLQQQKARHDRRPGQVFSVCFVALDHFRRVNDMFGHCKSDLVLKRFAEIARKAVREEDYVGRFGGEEFLLLLADTPKDNAALVAERIRRRMADLLISDEVPDFRVSASFGISAHQPGEEVETTLARADEALHAAGRGGRNRVALAADQPHRVGESFT